MYLRADADSYNAIPVLPDFYLVHLIFGFFPSLDVLLRPINVASSICDLETNISIISKQRRGRDIPCCA